MKKRTNDHGAASATKGSAGCLEEWRMAAELDQSHPCQDGARWVPLRSIFIDDRIAPRNVRWETVDQYAATYFELPAIKVQKDTFTLIDGRHRYEAGASGKAACVCIRAREMHVANADLAAEAFKANLVHGLPYTPAERIAGMRMLIPSEVGEHKRSAAHLAKLCGVSRDTAEKYVREFRERTERAKQPAENHAENPHIDNKVGPSQIQNPHVSEPKRSVVSTFDPGAEGQTYQDEDGNERAYADAQPAAPEEPVDEFGNTAAEREAAEAMRAKYGASTLPADPDYADLPFDDDDAERPAGVWVPLEVAMPAMYAIDRGAVYNDEDDAAAVNELAEALREGVQRPEAGPDEVFDIRHGWEVRVRRMSPGCSTDGLRAVLRDVLAHGWPAQEIREPAGVR